MTGLPAAHYLYLGREDSFTPCGKAVWWVETVTDPAAITCRQCLRYLGLAAAAELEDKARALGDVMRQRLAFLAAGQHDARPLVTGVIGEIEGILRRVRDRLDS